VVFVIAVNLMLDHRPPHLPGWGGHILGRVASIKQNSSGWLGSGAWLVVGLAAVPSAALLAWLCARWTHPTLLAGALLLQAFGIALPALAPGPSRPSSEQSCSGHLHRDQHDRPGSRTPARIPRRRGVAD